MKNGSARRTLFENLPWFVVAALYVVIVYRTAWVGDDAFITLRTVDNFLNGYGLRWNVLERVQTYTHPLWMLLLLAVYAITREPFYTTLALSAVVSLAALLVVARVARRGDPWGPLFAAILVVSRAYVDYSTSGLENPLSHLFSALFFLWVVAEKSTLSTSDKLLRGSLLVGLSALNREDSVLLFLPVLFWLSLRGHVGIKKALGSLSLGAVAPLAFTIFSLIYYGFPFPNTAYAKLNVEIPRSELVGRGLEYLYDFAVNDPVSAACLTIATLVVILSGRVLERALLVGIACYVLYIVSIGGDFMRGRFFSIPLLLSVLLLIERAPRLGRIAQGAYVVGLTLLMLAPKYPLYRTVQDYPKPENIWKGSGIVDERLYYFRDASLLFDNPTHPIRPWHPRALEGYKYHGQKNLFMARGAVGYYGYFAGPGLHLVDIWGLCDPLLARIPFRPIDRWRMGHFERKRPKGYLDAVRGDASLIEQPFLAQVYEDLLLITRGPLFSAARFEAIYRLNTSYYRSGLKHLEY